MHSRATPTRTFTGGSLGQVTHLSGGSLGIVDNEAFWYWSGEAKQSGTSVVICNTCNVFMVSLYASMFALGEYAGTTSMQAR